MTGPAAGGTERGTRAPSRATGTQGAVGAVLVVLALGLALRLIIAYLLPGSGFGVDLGAFRSWAANLADRRPARLLRPRLLPRLHARLPVRPVAGRPRRERARRRRRLLIKIPPILADLAIGWLVWSMVLRARRPAAAWRSRPRSSRSSTRSPGSTASSGARSIRSASSSCCSACASCGATARSARRSSRSSRPSSSRSSGSSIPLVGASVTIRRALWPAGAARHGDAGRADAGRRGTAAGSCGTTHGPPDPDRHDGPRRAGHGRPDLPAVRAVGPRIQLDGAVLHVRAARADLRDRRRATRT